MPRRDTPISTRVRRRSSSSTPTAWSTDPASAPCPPGGGAQTRSGPCDALGWPLRSAQRLVQVGDEVCGGPKADRQSDGALGDPDLRPYAPDRAGFLPAWEAWFWWRLACQHSHSSDPVLVGLAADCAPAGREEARIAAGMTCPRVGG